MIGLTRESIWVDEATTVRMASSSSVITLITTLARIDTHPPLYNVFMFFWIRAFGTSEFFLRLPSVIFGVLSIWVLFKLGRRMFGQEVGFNGALILVLSSFHVIFSQEARMYSLLGLLALISSFLFVEILQDASRGIFQGRRFFLYLFVTELMMYTHLYSIFLIVAQDLFVLIRVMIDHEQVSFTRKGVLRDTTMKFLVYWLLVQIILAFLFLPWMMMVFMYQGFSFGDQVSWLKELTLPLALLTPLFFAGLPFYFYRPTDIAVQYFLPSFFNFGLFMYLTVKGASFFTKRGRTRCQHREKRIGGSSSTIDWFSKGWNEIFLWLVIVCVFIVPVIVSLLFKPIFFPKYSIVAAIIWYLLIAREMERIPKKRIQWKRALMLLILSCSLGSIMASNLLVLKPQWREAVSYIEHDAEKGDAVVFLESSDLKPYRYHSTRSDLYLEWIEDEGVLEGVILNHSRIWLVLTDKSLPSWVRNVLSAHAFELLKTIDEFKGIQILVFIKESLHAVQW